MKLPKELTTVTPLSKGLALFVFITLPFIGFFAGMRYQEIVDLANRQEQEAILSAPQRIPTSIPFPTVSPEVSIKPSLAITQKPTSTPVETPKDTTPPIIDQLGGPNGEISYDQFCFPIHVVDNVSKAPNIWIRYKFKGGDWNEWSTNMSPCFTTHGNDQSSTFSVEAKDEAGNISAPLTRTFTTKTH